MRVEMFKIKPKLEPPRCIYRDVKLITPHLAPLDHSYPTCPGFEYSGICIIIWFYINYID